MSSTDLTDWMIHTVTAEPYLGTSGSGQRLYGPQVTVPCFLTRKLQFVRNANGEQVASQATVSAEATWAGSFAPLSKVTVPGEQPTTVINQAVSTGGDFLPGLDRVKAYLQ